MPTPRITTFDNPATLAEAIDLYQHGASSADLAIKYGCSTSTVLRCLREAGVAIRSRSDYGHLPPKPDAHPQTPAVTFTDMPWYEDARCRTTGDPAWFYPDGGASHYSRQAKAVCSACPVRTQCLTWALENNERWGVWGGLSERERRQLQRDTKKAQPRRAAA